MFKALIILRISSSLKSKEFNRDCVRNISLTGSMLPFFKGVHCFAQRCTKNLLKIQTFLLMSVTNLSFTKRGGISGIFSRYKMFSVLTNRLLLVIKDYLTFYKGFHSTML